MTARPWRTAMAIALYGPAGFYRRSDTPGGWGADFRTSAAASPLFADAVLRLVAAVDEALERPEPLQVIDIGAGGGHLLHALALRAPAPLRRRLQLAAVEVSPRPPGLPAEIDWRDQLPRPGSITGLIVATEWLDNVPLDIAGGDEGGELSYVFVDETGHESLDGPLTGTDAAWVARWWSDPASAAQFGSRESDRSMSRIEVGAPRDRAWAEAVAALRRGLAFTVDYGHVSTDRPIHGTLTAYRSGRQVEVVPDGQRDLTAHVAIDAVRAAGEDVAGQAALLLRQRKALAALGISGRRPPRALATESASEYLRLLAAAGRAAELTDPAGLGAHYWLLQPVGIAVQTLPPGLRAEPAAAGVAR